MLTEIHLRSEVDPSQKAKVTVTAWDAMNFIHGMKITVSNSPDKWIVIWPWQRRLRHAIRQVFLHIRYQYWRFLRWGRRQLVKLGLMEKNDD